MQKNVAGQRWVVFAFNRTDSTPMTGNAANITANIRKDGGAGVATNDVNPTELERGFYLFDLTQAETNADMIQLAPVSATADIQVVPTPAVIYTAPAAFNASVSQTGDAFARIGAPAGASVSADVAAVKGETAAIIEDTSVIGAAGAGLTALPWNAAWDAEVQSECTDALNAYAPATAASVWAVGTRALTDKEGFRLSAQGVDDIHDEVIENTLTWRHLSRLNFATLAGKTTGGGTSTLNFRNHADNANRITATVDENGNRTAMTLNLG